MGCLTTVQAVRRDQSQPFFQELVSLQAGRLHQHPAGLPLRTGVTGRSLPSLGAEWRAETGFRSVPHGGVYLCLSMERAQFGSEEAEGQAGGWRPL